MTVAGTEKRRCSDVLSGYDEYHPESHTGKQMVPNGMGWIIIDALDTMMLMNLTTELEHSRQWIHSNLTYDQDHDVNTFETTIRMLGGLLSAHYLSVAFPGTYAPVADGLSDDLYIEKAVDLADRLLGAYNTKSGVPLASVNLHTMQGIPSHADGGASSTAEATTLQLEMKYLAKLTGETHYWEHAEKVMKVVDDNQARDGLVPIFIHADKGTFRGNNIRLGSRGDSYYEYLIKQYLQTSQQEPVYQEMWNESLAGVKKHLLTYSSPSNFTILAERPSGIDQYLSPKMDHLVCFMPGTIALATTGGRSLADARKDSNWGPQQEEDMRLAKELTKTCLGMYRTPTGLAPEIAHFNIYDPPLMYKDFTPETQPQSPPSFDRCVDKACTEKEAVGEEDYVVKSGDVHNLQRPETVESLFYMWRITGDEMYRKAGWEMFQSFMEYGAVSDGEGYSSVANVEKIPVTLRDNMESFWLVSPTSRQDTIEASRTNTTQAETLKYFYLLFSPNDILPLTDVVFNTEAHAFPKFEMGKLFKTGWQRKDRQSGSSGQPAVQSEEDPGEVPEIRTIQVQVTRTLHQEPLAPTEPATPAPAAP
jgi:mannosyl-oligosaccharide alpha-1,2-mannosidase